MKLHLPQPLRRAMLACIAVGLGSFCVSPSAYAENIFLSDTTIWQDSDMPGYTGSEETAYLASGINWNILEGTIADTSWLDISSSSTVSNGGKLTSAYTSTNDESIAISISSSSFTNEISGQLSSHAESTKQSSYQADSFLTAALHSNQSSITNEGTIAATARNYGNSFNCGMWLSSTSLSNAEGATLTAEAVSTTNIYTTDRYGSVHGIYAQSTTIVNNGKLTATGQVSYAQEGYGIYLEGEATLTNQIKGEIEATGGHTGIIRMPSDGWSFRAWLNSGKITAKGGIYGLWLIIGPMNNFGTMTASGGRAGIYLEGGTLTNYTTLYASANSDSEATYGILSESTLINEGILNVISNASTDAYGISGGSFDNKAGARVVVEASGGSSSTDISMVSFSNSGRLLANSVSGGALYLHDGSTSGARTEGGRLEISGSVVSLGSSVTDASDEGGTVALSSAISVTGGTLRVMNNVTLKMGGDLTVASDVTTTWNDHTLTIDNGGTRHSVSWKDEFAGSWSGSFTLSENDGGVKLVQEQVGTYVSLSHGSVTVGGGVLKASETLELGGGDTAMAIGSDTASLVLHGEHGGTILNAVIGADGVMVSAGEGNTLTLDSSVLTLGGGLNLLKNVIVMGSTQIKSEVGGSLSCDLVTFVLDSLNSSLGAQAVMAAEDDVALFITPYTSGGTAVVGTNIFDNVSVSGDMTLDLSFWAEEINSAGYDSLAFSLGDNTLAEGTEIRATLDGTTYATATYGADNMVVFNVESMSTPSIPEPTTATLSLLALTVLAARRRRK